MSKKLADFFQKLSTDAGFLGQFNSGATPTDLARNREALMNAEGLSEDDKNVVRGHDNAAADAVLRRQLGIQLDGWSNTSNTNVNISRVQKA
ncbi:MAG: hypothetical protein HYV16_04640 [Gammaproteobacteria bacterium]|nr:hypothetical protein [Gammaproteobacteria bacterium]